MAPHQLPEAAILRTWGPTDKVLFMQIHLVIILRLRDPTSSNETTGTPCIWFTASKNSDTVARPALAILANSPDKACLSYQSVHCPPTLLRQCATHGSHV